MPSSNEEGQFGGVGGHSDSVIPESLDAIQFLVPHRDNLEVGTPQSASVFSSPFENDERYTESSEATPTMAPVRAYGAVTERVGSGRPGVEDMVLGDLAVNGLTIGSMLGAGSYGSVYHGHHTVHGEVAIKLIHVEQAKYQKSLSDIRSEMLAGMRLNHPNIAQMYESCMHTRRAACQNTGSTPTRANDAPGNLSMILESVARSVDDANDMFRSLQVEGQGAPADLAFLLIQEFCNGGTLCEALKRGDFKDSDMDTKLKRLRDITLSVAYGIQYMHQNHIVHRDLSNNNVMLHYTNLPEDNDCTDTPRVTAKLIDFGRVSINAIRTGKTDGLTTISYAAPELMSDGHTSKASDVFSLGVLVWEVWTGEHAWDKARPVQIIYAISNGQRLDIPEDMPSVLADLVTGCWSLDPHERPTIDDVIRVLEEITGDCGLNQSPES